MHRMRTVHRAAAAGGAGGAEAAGAGGGEMHFNKTVLLSDHPDEMERNPMLLEAPNQTTICTLFFENALHG